MANCPECGAPMAESLKICRSCGGGSQEMHQDAAQTSAESDQAANGLAGNESVKKFVGSHYEYFERKWRLANHDNQKITWNWPAFLFGPAWLAYRKMYLYLGIFIAIVVPETIAEFLLDAPLIFTHAVSIGIAVVLGLFGNYWYERHVSRNVRRIIAENEPANADAELQRQGGTSIAAPAALLAAVGILGYLYIQGIIFPLPVTKAGYPLCTSERAAEQFQRLAEDSGYTRTSDTNVTGLAWQKKISESPDGQKLVCLAKLLFGNGQARIFRFTLTPAEDGYFYIRAKPMDSHKARSRI